MSISSDFTRRQAVIAVVAILALPVVVAVLGSLEYHGKILPGVALDGVKVGGMSQAEAQSAVKAAAVKYEQGQAVINYGTGSVAVPLSSLNINYSDTSQAYQYGRTGGFGEKLHATLRALFSRPTNVYSVSYNDAALAARLAPIEAAVDQPVSNASLNFTGDSVGVNPAAPGARLDTGTLVLALKKKLGSMGHDSLTAPVYYVKPAISDASLAATASQAQKYVSSPLTLRAGNQTRTVDQVTLVSWVNVGQADNLPTDTRLSMQSFYNLPALANVNLSINQMKVAAYVAGLAQSFDVEGKDAVLAMQGGKLTVLSPSEDGVALDQNAAISSIMNALNHPGSTRDLTLKAQVQKAVVNEDNLASLGITDQLSEGVTYFPGSSSARITNVSVGARRFNNVLLAPGEQFSFGKILGPVGAAQGYLPGLVILGNHEEYQYGGGLCQVASTAFRAALLAGLPINQRSNHSYAVNFYTAPFGVPGVDATIFYPEVDLKFTNDTGHYILIQTSISGTTLKFDFYGTKTKSGDIRGPQFIMGNSDAAKASKTVFYRDVKDLNGNVIKTDTFTQYYAPSTDFPIEQTSAGA